MAELGLITEYATEWVLYSRGSYIIFLDLLVRLIFERVLYSRASYNRENTVVYVVEQHF